MVSGGERERGVVVIGRHPPPHTASDTAELRGPGLCSESAVGERERLCDNEGLVLGEEGRQLGE